MDTTKKIVNYLNENGPMSGRDICDDCDVDPWEVEDAAQGGAIERTAPMPGGVPPWFCAA